MAKHHASNKENQHSHLQALPDLLTHNCLSVKCYLIEKHIIFFDNRRKTSLKIYSGFSFSFSEVFYTRLKWLSTRLSFNFQTYWIIEFCILCKSYCKQLQTVFAWKTILFLKISLDLKSGYFRGKKEQGSIFFFFFKQMLYFRDKGQLFFFFLF